MLPEYAGLLHHRVHAVPVVNSCTICAFYVRTQSEMTTHQHIPIRAVFCAVTAALMFATMGAAVRYSSQFLTNEMVVFLRNIFGFLFLLPWLHKKGFRNLGTKRPKTHLLRSLSGLTAMYCFFYAIANLQLAEAVLLNYASPIFIAVIALVWLGEKASPKLIAAVLLGFIGICFILKPGIGILQAAAWVGLLSAVFAALAMVTIRNLSATEPITRIVFYYCLICSVVSAFPAIWAWQTPPLGVLLVMGFAGLVATTGQMLLTYSYSLAPAARVGPYTYAAVIFAAIYGWIIWSERPDLFSAIGAVLVIIAGIMALQRKKFPRMTQPV